MIYFTTDLHIAHDKPFIYKPLGFENIDQYNYCITQYVCETVQRYDMLWVLGDISWRDPVSYLNQLAESMSEINIVLGNHDNDLYNRRHQLCKNIYVHRSPVNTKIEGQLVTLSHFPMLSWEKSHYNSWQLYGHVHGRELPIKGKLFDVIPRKEHPKPFSWDEIKEIMKLSPNNWDYIER